MEEGKKGRTKFYPSVALKPKDDIRFAPQFRADNYGERVGTARGMPRGKKDDDLSMARQGTTPLSFEKHSPSTVTREGGKLLSSFTGTRKRRGIPPSPTRSNIFPRKEEKRGGGRRGIICFTKPHEGGASAANFAIKKRTIPGKVEATEYSPPSRLKREEPRRLCSSTARKKKKKKRKKKKDDIMDCRDTT